ncbi:hypothetical protein [Roseomonas populi]|uniref:Uncharacterized protein n=1 Tax=Roseomonas populi TaxID=3121582 RepID=A0ABT1X3S1_9PROT|nr:hypothetical protein [Roseomonas pecuniae]MCR0982754.1 hypothetical protein [Roseomonas pecuniae]
MSDAEPRGPRLLRGALVSIDPVVPVPKLVVFQYNPDSVTRTLASRTAGEKGTRLSAPRLTGAPQESLRMDIEIDAADAGDAPGNAARLGIYPQLSLLEMLLYPSSIQVIANAVLLAAGTVELLPPPAPLTLLVWGAKRIVPVQLSDFTITEEAHDSLLNPIRAKVALGLTVLGYDDLSVTNPGYYVFLAHQVMKEGMAALNTVTDITAVAGGNVKLL